MPALSNLRHEAFAQGLLRGETADEAYANAGYKPNRHNASRLKTNETIRKRLDELQDRALRQNDVTVASLTEMLKQDRKDARANGQYSVAVSAITAMAKLHGLAIDKTENVNHNFGQVSADPMPASSEDWLSECKPH